MAIIHTCAQGTDEWLALRLGIPTASEFHRIVTAARGSLSKSAVTYAHALVAETLLGRPLAKPPGTPWAMARGKELEPFARADYAAANKVEIQQVGFVTTDDGRLGASPDGLIVGASGGVEIKCVLDENHVGIWAEGGPPGDDYKQQVQGSIAVCELDWWDLYAWHPNLPPITIRTYRDQAYITKMQVALVGFLDIRDELLAKAHASGWRARQSAPMPATFGALRAA